MKNTIHKKLINIATFNAPSYLGMEVGKMTINEKIIAQKFCPSGLLDMNIGIFFFINTSRAHGKSTLN